MFAYNDANRMGEVSRLSGVLASYVYNGMGERVRRTVNGFDTYTLYDPDGRWLGDFNSAGSPVQMAIWLGDLPVGLLVGAGNQQKLYYIEADALGSPRAVIDPQRNVAVWRWDAVGEAFGHHSPSEDPDGDGVVFNLDMRFPGQQYDSVTGFHYNYFRDYDPGTGRYVQSDPIGLDGGISTYGYANGSPTMYSDPDGLIVGRIALQLATRFVLPRLGVNVAARYAGRLAARRAIMSAARADASVAKTAFRSKVRTAESATCNAGSAVTRGEAGRFSDLAARGVKGDRLTPHHMPQVAARFTGRSEGGALVMPEAEHYMTRTYGYKGALTAREEAGMAFRDVLARDIRDVRNIGGSEYNQGLRNLIDYYRTNFPNLISRL